MSGQNNDQIIIERVQRGDKQAYNLLVQKYQSKVLSLISRFVKIKLMRLMLLKKLLLKLTEPCLTFEVKVLFILGCIELRSIQLKIT